jgi:hypothetical protein
MEVAMEKVVLCSQSADIFTRSGAKTRPFPSGWRSRDAEWSYLSSLLCSVRGVEK